VLTLFVINEIYSSDTGFPPSRLPATGREFS
jgi:hypothetical protein